MTPLYKFFNGLFSSCCFNIYIAIVGVFNKSIYIESLRSIDGEFSKKNTLNSSLNDDGDCLQEYYFPLKFAFLFSRKAVVPSVKSSVTKHFPNSLISVWKLLFPLS